MIHFSVFVSYVGLTSEAPDKVCVGTWLTMAQAVSEARKITQAGRGPVTIEAAGELIIDSPQTCDHQGVYDKAPYWCSGCCGELYRHD